MLGNIAGEQFRRFSLGSVAEKVSHHAPCSVLIVKRRTDIEKLLVAYDNSADSLKALKVAVELCKKFDNAKMTILNVENRELHRLEPNIAQQIGEKILTQASAHINGVVCDTRIEYGKPADMILKIAKLDDYDLILLGSRGLSSIRRFFTGSVGTYVSVNAHRSVLLVR